MLIVLDNACDADQVIPLLPGSETCIVLVTSRHHLTGLITTHHAQPVSLDVLSEAEARQLLADQLGTHRITAEPEAVNELLSYCAGLPLALVIVAARAATHPHLPLTVLTNELRETDARLAALDGGDVRSNLAVVFSWSYHAVSAEAAEMFCLICLVLAPPRTDISKPAEWMDISQPAVASLTGQPIERTRQLLRELDQGCLIQQSSSGRYQMHDLIKLYAAEQARRDHSEDSRSTALQRLVEYYLHTAWAADRIHYPDQKPITISPPLAGYYRHPLSNKDAADAWWNAEFLCLQAARQTAYDQGWNPAFVALTSLLSELYFGSGIPQNDIPGP